MTHPEQPFKVAIPDADIELLHKKLELTRYPDELEGAGWAYGAPAADVRRLATRWKDGFDWRAAEKKINELPQFTRDIDVDGYGTINIHYVHKKSEAKDAIPLLFVHGWPGHFLEVSKILPLLTAEGDHPSFNVVALSLPGFGFSEAPKKPGFGIRKFAEVGHKLMLSLGYDEYVAQGGDWGYMFCRFLAHVYGPKHVKAWHTNMPRGAEPTFSSSPLLYLQWVLTQTNEDKKGLEKNRLWDFQSRGYMAIQLSKPQTLGYSMADSPVGLLGWIYEKLVGWTDNYPWEDDEVLTWVSIYWFSRGGPTAAARIYYEYFNNPADLMTPYIPVPLGISYFPQELFYTPKLWMRTVGPVAHESSHTSGGHFAAYEKPNELVSDFREFVNTDAVMKSLKQ